MTKLQTTMKKFDAQADQVEDRAGFWQAMSLALTVWSGGGIPVSSLDPRVNRHLVPLYTAFKRLGDPLKVAVDARAFPI